MASEFGRNLGAMGAAAMVMQNAFEFSGRKNLNLLKQFYLIKV